jgi:hypothetical protein
VAGCVWGGRPRPLLLILDSEVPVLFVATTTNKINVKGGGRGPPAPHIRRLLNQRSAVHRLFFRHDYHCGGYSVSWFQVQQADALGGAARFADGV